MLVKTKSMPPPPAMQLKRKSLTPGADAGICKWGGGAQIVRKIVQLHTCQHSFATPSLLRGGSSIIIALFGGLFNHFVRTGRAQMPVQMSVTWGGATFSRITSFKCSSDFFPTFWGLFENFVRKGGGGGVAQPNVCKFQE